MGRLRAALAGPGLAAIAEIKRRSPSAGWLRPDLDVGRLAGELAAAGAAALSILVDERFAGSLDDLRAAQAAEVPLLAKGFFRSAAEIDELAAAGADAVLLIMRDLDDRALSRLAAQAAAQGLDALLEAHDASEVARARALAPALLGVNARDLGTLQIDRRRQLELLALATGPWTLIAESGITTRAQAAAAELAGAEAILVGEALMRAADPAAKLEELLTRPLVKVCGLTRVEDVELAVSAGADLLGFVLAPSPRRAARVLDAPDTVLRVAVAVDAVDPAAAAAADLVQLYPSVAGVRGDAAVLYQGPRPVAEVWDLPWLAAAAEPARWSEAQGRTRVVLAGRLGPDNVAAAVRAARPWAVDAASRLEAAPGVKDPALVRDFVAQARAAGSGLAR